MVSQLKQGTGVTISTKIKIYARIKESSYSPQYLDGISRVRVISIESNKFDAKLPNGNTLICRYSGCGHLNGGSWRLVYGNNKPVKDIRKFIGVELC